MASVPGDYLPDELSLRLARLEAHLRRLALVRGVGITAVVLTAGIAIGLILDRTWEFGLEVRIGLLAVLSVAVLATLARLAVRPLFRRVDSAALAALAFTCHYGRRGVSCRSGPVIIDRGRTLAGLPAHGRTRLWLCLWLVRHHHQSDAPHFGFARRLHRFSHAPVEYWRRGATLSWRVYGNRGSPTLASPRHANLVDVDHDGAGWLCWLAWAGWLPG